MNKLLASFALAVAAVVAEAAEPSVTVCPFFGGRDGVFLLAFDDSCVSQLANAIPVLEKYRVPGTFYIITESGQFKAKKAAWAEAAKVALAKGK